MSHDFSINGIDVKIFATLDRLMTDICLQLSLSHRINLLTSTIICTIKNKYFLERMIALMKNLFNISKLYFKM